MLLAIFGIGLTSILTPAPASAIEVCKEIVGRDGQVTLVCYDDGGGGGGGSDGGGDGGGGGGGPVTCIYGHITVPCSSNAGTWIGNCYVQAANPAPPFEDPIWGGNTDGVIVVCTPWPCMSAGGATIPDCPSINRYWAPAVPAATVNPADLARQAVADMALKMGAIGSTPPSTATDPDSLGVVGTPIWLWVTNPAENTTGPITRNASDGGITVTATGRLDRIEWALISSSGTTVATTTCSGTKAPGTAYSGQGLTPSPTCGIPAAQNQGVGEYTLRGTAHWVVEWTGAGQSGTITVPGQSADAAIRIGELQTIITTG